MRRHQSTAALLAHPWPAASARFALPHAPILHGVESDGFFEGSRHGVAKGWLFVETLRTGQKANEPELSSHVFLVVFVFWVGIMCFFLCVLFSGWFFIRGFNLIIAGGKYVDERF